MRLRIHSNHSCPQLQLSAGHDSSASFWKFKKLEKVDGDPQPVCLFALITVIQNLTNRLQAGSDETVCGCSRKASNSTRFSDQKRLHRDHTGWLVNNHYLSENFLLSNILHSVVERSPAEIVLILSEFAALSMGRSRRKILSVVGIALTRQ